MDRRLDLRGESFLVMRETIGGKIPLKAYQLKNDRWTIGIGLTYFPNGIRVKEGDYYKSREEAIRDFVLIVHRDYGNSINQFFKDKELTQNQFNALVSYCFNRGFSTAKKTKLFKMILSDPNDENIREQFVKDWGTNMTYEKALKDRRKLEAQLYFN